jgi:hypothetical protein
MDQRDRDELLLSGSSPPATASPTDPSAASLQAILDRATGGAMPRWQNDQWLEDGLCVAFHGDRRCDRPETDWVWIGCPHEHINRSGLCRNHADGVERGGFYYRCQVCYDRTGQIVTARFIKRELIPDGASRQAPASTQVPEQDGGAWNPAR